MVSYRPALPVEKLKKGTRVSLDMTTLTIMRILPREVDPMVYKMSLEDPGGATFAGIGGLGEQVRELREVSLTLSTSRTVCTTFYLGYRTASPEPRAFPTCRHPATERCAAIWPTRDWQNTSGACGSCDTTDQFLEGSLVCYRRQVYWRVGACSAGDVWICEGTRAMRYLHG